MWGDPERAHRLDASDNLSMLLFQVASPAHIPWTDPRWSELLHGSDVWVHCEVRDDPDGIMQQACQSMARHAAHSSNLAALARLVSRMLDELHPPSNDIGHDQVAAFSERIAVVGKARAAAGALQLIRLFIHRIVVNHGNQPAILVDIFTYRSRDASEKDVDVGRDLLASIFCFLTAEITRQRILQVPEMYDTVVLTLHLVLVMLSTQLYQTMLSSFQKSQQKLLTNTDFFLDLLMDETRQEGHQKIDKKAKRDTPTPKEILSTCLYWQIYRPKAPERSISRYHIGLAQSVAAAKGEKLGLDGMYESNLVVSAAAQTTNKLHDSTNRLGESSSSLLSSSLHKSQPSFLLDVAGGVLIQASSIIMLPFRLVRLALGLWGHKEKGFQQSRADHYRSSIGQSSRTRDVLWISEAPISDLMSSLFLLLTNNRRAAKSTVNKTPKKNESEINPFRVELAKLADDRWGDGELNESSLPDLPDPTGSPQHNESLSLLYSFEQQEEHIKATPIGPRRDHHLHLTCNFEKLFLSFGAILHTEIGALLIYTLLQSSQAFSDTIAVRSDLDTLVLPLLRTLYFSSSTRHVSALDFQAKKNDGITPKDDGKSPLVIDNPQKLQLASIRTMPFRSTSQLYCIVILLLLFSQDPSFGSDAFKRTMVPSLPWYKERYLKDVSLGSVVILALLRCLTFNLNRLHDLFLLSNCCAVLMNLSHSVVDLHEYAAMRLASVTVSCLKKYVALSEEENKKHEGANGGAEADETLLDMYSEVSHTLLRLLKHALAHKNIEKNLHLAYALVYHQADFKKIFSLKRTYDYRLPSWRQLRSQWCALL